MVALEPSALYLYSMAPLWAGVATYSNETFLSYLDGLSVKVEDFMRNVTTSLIYLQGDPDPEVVAIIAEVNVLGTVVTVPPIDTYTKHVVMGNLRNGAGHKSMLHFARCLYAFLQPKQGTAFIFCGFSGNSQPNPRQDFGNRRYSVV